MRDNIKFYKLGEESDQEVISYDNKRVEINNLKEKEKQEDEYTKTMNVGLKNVIDKDIEELSNKLKEVNKRIITTLSTNGVAYAEVLDNDVKNIDANLLKVEDLISRVIIEKDNLKIGIFTTKKNEKKERIKSLGEAVEYLTKCQNDIIALKDEYNKLEKRKEKVQSVESVDDQKSSKSLEQTINFYLKQRKEN